MTQDEVLNIVGHCAPDVDCATAMWLALRLLCPRWFPGRPTELVFVPANKIPKLVNDTQNYPIIVDGGGVYDSARRRFDTHGRADLNRESATSLIARELPQDVRDRLRPMLHAVQIHDTSGSDFSKIGSFYGLLFMSYRNEQDGDLLAVLRWHKILDEYYHKLVVNSANSTWGVNNTRFVEPHIAILPTDAARVASTMLFRSGKALYTVYQRSSNQIGIVANIQMTGASLPFGIQREVLAALERRGAASQFSEWFFHPGRHVALRGSSKSPLDTPSILTQDEVAEILQRLLTASENQEMFLKSAAALEQLRLRAAEAGMAEAVAPEEEAEEEELPAL